MLNQLQNADPQGAADTALLEIDPVVGTEARAPVALKQSEPAGKKPRILEEVVIEEVSIDGMCGVY